MPIGILTPHGPNPPHPPHLPHPPLTHPRPHLARLPALLLALADSDAAQEAVVGVQHAPPRQRLRVEV
eukprot:358200-Chlamydomonas_euryale.AAC.3